VAPKQSPPAGDKQPTQAQLKRFLAFDAEAREHGVEVDDALTIAEQVDI